MHEGLEPWRTCEMASQKMDYYAEMRSFGCLVTRKKQGGGRAIGGRKLDGHDSGSGSGEMPPMEEGMDYGSGEMPPPMEPGMDMGSADMPPPPEGEMPPPGMEDPAMAGREGNMIGKDACET